MKGRLNSKNNRKQLLLLVSILLCCLYNSLNALYAVAQDEDVTGMANNQSLLKARQLMIEGTDYLHSNQNDLAKAKLTEACSLVPDLPQAHHQLGIALAKLGENDQAILEFSTAIKLDPNMAASLLNLAAVYQSAGNIEQAKETYKQFISSFPQDRDISKIRALVAALDKEVSNQPQTNGLTAAAVSQAAGVPAVASFTSISASHGADDYYDDIAKKGVWLWQKDSMPLSVCIEGADSHNGAQAQYISILKNAFRDWVMASEGMISVTFVEDPSKAAITCKWSKDISKFKNSSEAANTKIYAGKSGLTKGEIEILTISSSDGSPITENQARATCLHEVGHVLGLTGHSSNANDAMYMSASLQDRWAMLSSRDKNTIMHLYSGNK